MTCRICQAPTTEILDLGSSPPANALTVTADEPQTSYPLVVEWCPSCGNVQLRDALSADVLYRDYLYTTPRSPTLDAHYDILISYLRMKEILNRGTSVVEIGSNVGHFLGRLSHEASRVLGVDPAREIADEANRSGIPTIAEFFDSVSARRILQDWGRADLIVARHCLAHNESPHEMLAAAALILAEGGHLLIENAYVVNTIENIEFDQIYHEHMFYYSVTSMSALLGQHGMRLVDAWLTPVHGGSIVFVASVDDGQTVSSRVDEFLTSEASILTASSFARFAGRSHTVRKDLRDLVVGLRRAGKRVYGYGASAKGNTLLNSSAISREHIPYTVDSTPMKQGRFLPGSRIEVIPEGSSHPAPDYYLLTAWNYEAEIIRKVRDGGNRATRFIVPIPSVRVV